jgi:hypothetical protein
MLPKESQKSLLDQVPAESGPVEKQDTPSTLQFLRDKTIALNLVIMIFMWITVGFSFYMVKF